MASYHSVPPASPCIVNEGLLCYPQNTVKYENETITYPIYPSSNHPVKYFKTKIKHLFKYSAWQYRGVLAQ